MSRPNINKMPGLANKTHEGSKPAVVPLKAQGGSHRGSESWREGGDSPHSEFRRVVCDRFGFLKKQMPTTEDSKVHDSGDKLMTASGKDLSKGSVKGSIKGSIKESVKASGGSIASVGSKKSDHKETPQPQAPGQSPSIQNAFHHGVRETDEKFHNIIADAGGEGGEPESMHFKYVNGVTKDYSYPVATIRRYTITNVNQYQVQVIDYGATITAIRVPDFNGHNTDIVLGFEDMDGYTKEENPHFGGLLGRYSSVISESYFIIKEHEYDVTPTSNGNHWHGGKEGFDKVAWDSCIRDDKVIMTYVSVDNEEGYPGNLFIQVEFELTDSNKFIVHTRAYTSKTTPISIGHCLYVNLAGHGMGPEGLDEHCIMVNADRFLPQENDTHIPTGEIKDVASTFYDLRVPRPMGTALDKVPGKGYEHTFCLTKGTAKNAVVFASRLIHPETGRYMEIYTDHPTIHIYTGNDLPNPDELPPPPPPKVVERIEVDEGGEFIHENVEDVDEGRWPRPQSHEGAGEDGRSSTLSVSSEESGESKKDKKKKRGSADEDLVQKFPSISPDQGSSRGTSRSPSRSSVQAPPSICDALNAALEGLEHEVDELVYPDGWTPPKPIMGKEGRGYRNHGAIRLMPQDYPDSVNQPNFPTSVLKPGDIYERTTIYRFGIIRRPPAHIEQLSYHEVEHA